MENNTTTNDLFVAASRRKLRIVSARGELTVEQLWDLNLKSLDAIAIHLDAQTATRKSFLENPDRAEDLAAKDNQLALGIVTFVIGAKQDENKAAAVARTMAGRRALLERLLDKKEIDRLENMTEEQIQAELAAMPAH